MSHIHGDTVKDGWTVRQTCECTYKDGDLHIHVRMQRHVHIYYMYTHVHINTHILHVHTKVCNIRPQNYVRQSDIIWSTFGISEHVSAAGVFRSMPTKTKYHLLVYKAFKAFAMAASHTVSA